MPMAHSQVYDSLKDSGEMPEASLAYFDAEGAESLLYELRFLAVDKRVEPAMYIVANNLDVKARCDINVAVPIAARSMTSQRVRIPANLMHAAHAA